MASTDVLSPEATTSSSSSTSASASTSTSTSSTNQDAATRLFNLRLKLNQSRYENKQDVINEDRRERKVGQKSKKEEAEEAKQKEEEELQKEGVDPEKEKLLNATVMDAEWMASRKKKKRKQALPGTNDPLIHYNAYKKRVTSLEAKTSAEEYEEAKKQQPDFYRDADSLNYGREAAPVSKDKVERMVGELDEVMQRRANFSRRRTSYEDADVDFINNGNRSFNQKAAKALNKYTLEIKQNLERGTAL